MKKLVAIATAGILAAAVAAPAAYADNDELGAAALGFFIGSVTAQPQRTYRSRMRVVIPAPRVTQRHAYAWRGHRYHGERRDRHHERHWGHRHHEHHWGRRERDRHGWHQRRDQGWHRDHRH